MASNKFDDYIMNAIQKSSAEEKGSQRDSVDWLKSNVKDILNDRNTLKESSNAKIPAGLGKSELTTRLDKNSIGRMYMYVYDPKHKETLPYYDALPLIFLIAFTPDGFYGLNLHYVPPMIRLQIIEALTKNLNRANLSESSKIKISYNILRKSVQFSVIKHCFKRYLASHVMSRFMFIDPAEWNKSVMLPTERFKKATKNTVYRNFTSSRLKGKY